jgi:glycerate kinase
MVEELDRGLRRFAEVVERDLGVAVAEMEGAGAAGGLGAGLVAFCGAELVSGIDTILETVGFDEKMKGVGLVISGEGKLDLQTVQGKAISGILKRTKPKKIPLVILAGVVEGDEEEYRREGVKETISFGKRAKSDEDSIRNAAKYLADAAEELARDWKD